MRVIWTIASLMAAIALEAQAGRLLLSGNALAPAWHVAASLSGALAASFSLPVERRQGWLRFALFFVLMLCMPGFALAGVFLAVLPALFYPRKRHDAPWKEIPVPELPFRPVRVGIRANYGEGGLASVIQSARDPERRIRAVIAARQINDKLAVPLLQEALKDPVDDVRLFAYSVLDSKETRINERINELLADLEGADGRDRARMHYALAQHYWEMAFLGLATGNTFDYVLEQAERHAGLASELGWSGPDVEFFLGRIHLRRGRYDKAEQVFRESVHRGALESAVLPFLAEIAFERGNFHAVRAMLFRLNRFCDGHPPIPAVVQSWGVDR